MRHLCLLLSFVLLASGATQEFNPRMAAAVMTAVGASTIPPDWVAAFAADEPFASSAVAQALFVRRFASLILYERPGVALPADYMCDALGRAAEKAYKLMGMYGEPYPGIGDGVTDQRTPAAARVAYQSMCAERQLSPWPRQAYDDLLFIYTRHNQLAPLVQ